MGGRGRRLGRALARVALGGLGLVSALVIGLGAAAQLTEPPSLERPSSQVIRGAHGEWLRIFATEDAGGQWRMPVRRAELPQHLVDAVLCFEDRRFFRHPGVDPLAILRATLQNLSAGRVVSGGSTLTMQLARMLERRPRTLRAKLVEAFRALQLEARHDKDRLLTAYFDLAPYGGNIEGVGAAAYFYYGKDVADLSLDEAATLAAIPNAPNRLRPDRGPAALLARRNDVLDRMAEAGAITPEARDAARALPIHARRRDAPLEAPHLSTSLHAEHPGVDRLATTLDGALQHRAERLLDDHLAGLAPKGIGNGAVVVIENATRAVRAYVGSRAFFDVAIQGQVDGVRAPRSPGSTLKPFVYASALDRGLIGVHSLLADAPVTWGDWSPANFDGRFRGAVSARDALVQSLNVPAVQLAERLEPDGLVSLLQRAGLSTFADGPARYGLAAVLGGCEVTLLELTNLYASLALGGLHAPPRLLEDAEPTPPVRLWSPGAAYLIAELLSELQRPELAEVWRDTSSIPRLAWKTGTSYGRRDAWSIGFNRRWTVGVWIGNFDGTGVPELVGGRAAAPLLLALAQQLPGTTSEPWFEPPPELQPRTICPLSGAPVGPDCPHHERELALASAPARPCRLHVSLEIDDASGHRLCSRCRGDRARHTEVHVVWPAELAPWLERAGLAVGRLPEHDPGCERGLSDGPPVIHQPHDGDQFVLRGGVPSEHQQIALLAAPLGGHGPIWWFVNGRLLARVEGGTTAMLDPVPGTHDLVAVDAEGRRAAVRISVAQ